MSLLEPAAGGGHMAEALRPYFGAVKTEDVFDHGYYRLDEIHDFLFMVPRTPTHDWIITNPPYNQALDFTLRALDEAKVGVAMFCRSSFKQGKERYRKLFKNRPPVLIAEFVERPDLHEGHLAPTDESLVPYSWFIWGVEPRPVGIGSTATCWIEECKDKLTRDGDYAQPTAISNPPSTEGGF